ncbi:MAG: hypothetical protein HY744_28185 [Deltaproteobacteria bacterium]|nr:hypothetical protein [Deltaproteobacteria bacterium]
MACEDLGGFNAIAVSHLDRLLGGLLLATGPRLDWHKLLRRTYGFDALECPRCHGGRLRPIAVITEPATVRRILDHLDGLLARPPPSGARPARAATGVALAPPPS